MDTLTVALPPTQFTVHVPLGKPLQEPREKATRKGRRAKDFRRFIEHPMTWFASPSPSRKTRNLPQLTVPR
jgi:hypothetical protein